MPSSAILTINEVLRSPRLPTLPTVALMAIECVSDPDWTVEQLSGIIRNDPAITGFLLQTASRTHIWSKREIISIEDAVIVLGKNTTAAVALGFVLKPDLVLNEQLRSAYSEYWKGAVIQGIAAESLLEKDDRRRGEFFLTGLLADAGILAMLHTLGEPYAKMMIRADMQTCQLSALEAQEYGFSHVDVSQRLVSAWGVSDGIVEAIQCQHAAVTDLLGPDAVVLTQLGAACFIASQVADMFLGRPAPNAGILVESVAGRYFRLSINQLLQRTHERLGGISALLEVDPSTYPSVEEITQAARLRLMSMLKQQ